jgi:hypothetical protein
MLGAMAPGMRIHPLVPDLFAVIVVGVLVILVARSAGDDDPVASAPSTTASTTTTTEASTSTTTTAPEPVSVDALIVAGPEVDAPMTYRITYDVVENGLVRVEEWTVRRPYESLVLSRRGDVLLSGTSTSRTVLQTYLSDREGWLPVQPELHRAAFDQHPAGAVAAMEALGLVEEQGRQEHLGRTCTVYRTGQPPSAGRATAPSDDEHTDVCIDGSGLVLHERWEIAGSVVAERTATEVEIEPEVDPESFRPGPVVDEADAVSQLFTIIAVPADEETLARLETELPVPEGYTDDGAVFRAAHGGGGAGGMVTSGSAEIVRFYSSGPSLLEVAEVFVAGDAELASASAVPVEVDGWDAVWFEPGFRNSSLRARTGGSSYVDLRHHDVAFLFEVLASLERTDG